MNKRFASAVLAVLLGMAAFTMISSAASLIFEAALSNDITKITSVSQDMEALISYIRNSAIGLVVFSAAALASYCFTYFTKAKKLFGCISAGLSLALAVFCIAFVFDLRGIALESASQQVYTATTAYFSELVTLAVSALLLCACFTVVTIKAFTAETAQTEAANENVLNNAEEENNEKN
ncbi:MAG: hypothetical protein K2L42_05870 [Clostridia bacterium]|nr:hypothetical protein [Clostridia bacterium]